MRIPAENIWHDLSWAELLDHYDAIIKRELARQELNKTYYFSLFKVQNPDYRQIERTKLKIEDAQYRIDLMIEIVNRLDTHNILVYLKSLDFCFESEKKRGAKPPENYQIMIVKRNDYFKTYYFPIKDE